MASVCLAAIVVVIIVVSAASAVVVVIVVVVCAVAHSMSEVKQPCFVSACNRAQWI